MESLNELATIKGVRCRLNRDGNPELHIEDVAKGLGFTQSKNGAEYIRWERVDGYLEESGFSPQVGKDYFIPENIFYKLCFKANNEVARAFQDKVTDEILPAIRKHGVYATDDFIKKALTSPEFGIRVLTQLQAEREQRERLEAENKEQQNQLKLQEPMVIFANAVAGSEESILIGVMAKILRQNGIKIGGNRLFKWLRENGYLVQRKGSDYNLPTQRSMEIGVLEVKEYAIPLPGGFSKITRTPYVTGKGQTYFVDKFLKESAKLTVQPV